MIVKEIVEAHGVVVGVESTLGAGIVASIAASARVALGTRHMTTPDNFDALLTGCASI